MDNINSFKIPFLDINISVLSGYSLILTIFVILTMLGIFLKKKLKSYINKRQKLIDVSEEYERKRQCRNNLRYHYDWALDRGEKESAHNIGKEILKLDKELQEMYEDYQYLKEKGYYPLKNL